MTRLILVRHGQTNWNISQQYQGQADMPLNARGRWEMQRTAAHLATMKPQQIVTSDLCRAYDSAYLIARRHNLQPIADVRLREMNLGRWQGRPYSVAQHSPDWLETAPHGGETAAQLHARIRAWHHE